MKETRFEGVAIEGSSIEGTSIEKVSTEGVSIGGTSTEGSSIEGTSIERRVSRWVQACGRFSEISVAILEALFSWPTAS